MIRTEFFSLPTGEIIGYRIKGHSDIAESGSDVLCAFVSSAGIMAANTISEVIKARADIYCSDDGEIYVMIKRDDAALCKDILEGLKLHLISTEEQYPDDLTVNYTEV